MSVNVIAMPEASIVAVTVGAAAWIAANTSASVAAEPRSTATELPLRSTTLKSVPVTVRTPAPWFSVVSAVLNASALKPLASIRFALAPPTSQARSMPDSASFSEPTVSWLLVRMKLASRDSYSVSRPRPPSMMSAPAPPEITSLPAPPFSVFARALPMIVSSKAEPVTLLKPDSSVKLVDRPPARFTTTAFAAAEKSIELTPVPPCRISIPSKARLLAPLTMMKLPSASWVTATSAVTAVKTILSMPSPSFPPAASTIVSTPQPLAST